ncbi:transposase (plasmid) [Deinococcus sp. QL22]|nr:transposase [Deinococcus sp. QL22]UQN08097.1 transposase [Deinococcus sp. QL22]
MALIFTRLPPGKWLLSLDRTTWDDGESPMNLLVLGVVMEGYTIPVVWDALEHTGRSDTQTRRWLVSQRLRVFPASRWRGRVADREFISAEWFRFLRKSGIKRAVRVKKNTQLDSLRASEWFDDIAPGQSRCLADKACVFGEVMQVVATRSPAGDLVLIATNFNVWDTVLLYRRRCPGGRHVQQPELQRL